MRYARVYRQIWDDDKVRALPEDSRNLFLYLLTSKHMNDFGLAVLDDYYIIADLQWTPDRLAAAWPPLKTGMVQRDGRLVFLVNALKHNVPDNPNVLKKWTEVISCFGSSALIQQFFDRARILLPDKPFIREWLNSLPNGSCNRSSNGSDEFLKSRSKSQTQTQTQTQSQSQTLAATTENEFEEDRILQELAKGITDALGQTISPVMGEELKAYALTYKGPVDWISDAFKEAVNNNVRKWSYVKTILNDWQANGKQPRAQPHKQRLPVGL